MGHVGNKTPPNIISALEITFSIATQCSWSVFPQLKQIYVTAVQSNVISLLETLYNFYHFSFFSEVLIQWWLHEFWACTLWCGCSGYYCFIKWMKMGCGRKIRYIWVRLALTSVDSASPWKVFFFIKYSASLTFFYNIRT